MSGRIQDDDASEPSRQARTSAGAAMDPGLARHLSELARELETAQDIKMVMHRIVTAAVDEINGAIGASITLLLDGEISSPAHSDEFAAKVGEIQRTTRTGPCVETAREQITIRADDLNTETRWPAFTSRALELGVQSVLSFQLFVEGDSMGALDVYGSEINAFDAEAENTGLLLASHAAIAMAASRDITNLHAGMDTRDIIGQAKGILMERYKIAPHEAFDLLVMASQRTHRKLRDIADELAATGELNGPRGPAKRRERNRNSK
jgi:transcriptional regulator with GAF, ATPase, and Fis domain